MEEVGIITNHRPDTEGIEEKMAAAVRTWWDTYVLNSPVSRSAEAYSHLHRSLPALRAGLAAVLKEED